jgi:hypothetical protein
MDVESAPNPERRPLRDAVWVRWLLFLLCGLALALRQIELILHPRFWAEEATVYLTAAVSGAELSDLLTAPHLGFFSLIGNLGGVLAAALPLERAPLAPLMLAFAVQLLPFAVVILGRAEVWATIERKTVACLILLVFGAAGELHLNTAISHFHLTVLAALIYVETGAVDRPGTAAEGLLVSLLALAGFSSPQACMLMPAFWWRRIRQRRRFDRAASLVLTVGVMVQSSAVLLSPADGAGDRFRSTGELGERVWEFVQAMTKFPLFGDLSDKHGLVVIVLLAIGSAAFFVVQARVAMRGSHRDWLAIAWGVTFASVLTSRRMAGGERYQLMACVLLGLVLLAMAIDRAQPMMWRRLAGGLLAIGIVVQTAIWPARVAGSYDPDWPVWREEVEAWRAGERDTLRIHPQWSDAPWSVTLPERLRTP